MPKKASVSFSRRSALKPDQPDQPGDRADDQQDRERHATSVQVSRREQPADQRAAEQQQQHHHRDPLDLFGDVVHVALEFVVAVGVGGSVSAVTKTARKP